jgi:hypothetical protein
MSIATSPRPAAQPRPPSTTRGAIRCHSYRDLALLAVLEGYVHFDPGFERGEWVENVEGDLEPCDLAKRSRPARRSQPCAQVAS